MSLSNDVETPDPSITPRRRMFTTAGLGLGAALLYNKNASAATTSPASQNVILCGADPTGVSDSSSAFNTAFSNLPPAGGTIVVPGGMYRLNSPLSFSGKALCIRGEGSASTSLLMAHTGVAITFTGNNTSYPSTQPFSIIGIGIAGPTSGALAIGGVFASYPHTGSDPGYQYVLIDDVSIGTAQTNASNGCSILIGISLSNVWASQVRNARMFGPFNAGSNVPVFINLGGTNNIDVTFADCAADNVGIGFQVSAYTEGLRIINPRVIASYGFDSSSFDGNLNPGINVLGLYIIGGEFNTFVQGANLYAVTQAYISDTHFGCSNPSVGGASGQAGVVNLTKCLGVRMSNVMVSGDYPPSQTGYGLSLTASNLCQIDGVLFLNLNSGLVYNTGCTGNSATGLQLVNESAYPRLQSLPAAVDNSGITATGANNAQWMSANGTYQTLR